jgi:uncharacterized protein
MHEPDTSVLIARLRAVLEDEPRVGFAVLFGSVARGTAHEGSDVDVAYVPAPGAIWSLNDELGLEGALAGAAGCEVDLVRFDEADLPLRWRVVRDGVVILARSARDAKRAFAETALEHADIAPLLERANATYLSRVARGDPGPESPR